MSPGRDWRSFNDTWRDRQAEMALDQTLKALRWLFDTSERGIKRLEPLGILLAVIGLAVSIYSFQIDYQDRTVERKLRAWETVAADGPFSGGKADASAFLIDSDNDLSGAELEGAPWSYRELTNINLARANLNDAVLVSVDLSGANLSRAVLTEANLVRADLTGANLSRAVLTRANLLGANLTGANLSEANLIEANLARAIVIKAYLFAVDLTGADLSNADLTSTRLHNTNLDGANLVGADLSKAALHGADLAGARGLKQEQLNDACGDETTLENLPEDLTIQNCLDAEWFLQPIYRKNAYPPAPDEGLKSKFAESIPMGSTAVH